MEHIHFVIYRLKSIIIIFVIFFSDRFLPLSRLVIYNTHEKFRLEEKKMIFQGEGKWNNRRLLILKEKISDKVLQVFILFLLILNIIIILFMLLCFTGK
jgi:uncharacterized membrane protein